MFKDYKSGGYNLEETGVSDERLINMILLIAIAYSTAVIKGGKIKQMGGQKYGLYRSNYAELVSKCQQIKQRI